MPTFEYQAIQQGGISERGTVLGSTLEQAIETLTRRGLEVQKIEPAASHHDPLAGFDTFEPAVPVAPLPPAPVQQAVPVAPTPTQQVNSQPDPNTIAYQPVPNPAAYQAVLPPGTPDQPVVEGPPVAPRAYIESHVIGQVVGRVDLKDLAFMFRQFASMEHAGVPMVSTLQTLSKQSERTSGKLAHVLHEMSQQVAVGRPASFGMQRYPEVFSPLMVSLVRAGEEGGFLVDALRQVSDYCEEEMELRRLYKKVTFQPKLIFFGSIIIFSGANLIIGMLGHKGTLETPLTNPYVWMVLGPLLIGAYLWLRVGLANPRLRYNWDAFILRIPYLGNTLHQYSMAKFGRAFGALYAGGVAVPKAVEMAADACGNEFIRAQIHPASGKLGEGSAITKTLGETGAFNPLVLNMLATGETTGNVNQMLDKVANFYEDEAKVRAQQLAQVSGVVMLLIAGAYVLYIAVSFYGGYLSQVTNTANS